MAVHTDHTVKPAPRSHPGVRGTASRRTDLVAVRCRRCRRMIQRDPYSLNAHVNSKLCAHRRRWLPKGVRAFFTTDSRRKSQTPRMPHARPPPTCAGIGHMGRNGFVSVLTSNRTLAVRHPEWATAQRPFTWWTMRTWNLLPVVERRGERAEWIWDETHRALKVLRCYAEYLLLGDEERR